MLPKRILYECLKDIFIYLFNVCAMVVVLEHIHYSDHKSFEIINTFVDAVSLGLIVITVELLEDPKNETPLSSEKYNEKKIENEAKQLHLKLKFSYRRLISYSSTIHIFMNDYSVEDVDLLLCDVLQVSGYILIYIYVYVCIYIYTYVHVYSYIYVRVYNYIHIYLSIYICIYINIHLYK
jgi:hypothetical protein